MHRHKQDVAKDGCLSPNEALAGTFSKKSSCRNLPVRGGLGSLWDIGGAMGTAENRKGL
jgi:hypothetical protein